MPNSRPSRSYAKAARQAFAISAVLHFGIVGLLAAWRVEFPRLDPTRLGGTRSNQIVMVLLQPEAEPTTFEPVVMETPVLITPERARMAEQSFVEMPSADVTLEQMLAREPMSASLLESAVQRIWTDAVERPEARDVSVTRREVQLAASDIAATAASAPVPAVSPPMETPEAIRPARAEAPRAEVPRLEPERAVQTPRRENLGATSPPTHVPIEVPRPEEPEEPHERDRESAVQLAQTPPPPAGEAETTGPATGEGEMTPPDFRGNSPPRYPDQARTRRFEGVVRLRLQVDREGRVTRVDVVQTSGFSILDAAAVQTVRTWHGKPALRDGQPIATSWDLPVRFSLR